MAAKVVAAVTNKEISIIHGLSITDMVAWKDAEMLSSISPDAIASRSCGSVKMAAIIGTDNNTEPIAFPTENTARNIKI